MVWQVRPGDPLNERDRETLYWVSVLDGYKAVAKKTGVRLQAVKGRMSAILCKMGLHTGAQAVRTAIMDGLIGRDIDCGSERTYQRHRRQHVKSDPRCLMAHDAYDRARAGTRDAGRRFDRNEEGES